MGKNAKIPQQRKSRSGGPLIDRAVGVYDHYRMHSIEKQFYSEIRARTHAAGKAIDNCHLVSLMRIRRHTLLSDVRKFGASKRGINY